MKEISFDDLLQEKPKSATSLKVKPPKPDKPSQVAGRPYQPKEHRETPANWSSPQPEAIILFWSHTKCQCCGQEYSHPTYQQNSCLVRYRVSRFRTLLRPYNPCDEHRLRNLPRLKETTEATVKHCDQCFDSLSFSNFLQPDLFSEVPLPGFASSNAPIKPFIEVCDDDQFEKELNHATND